MLDNGIDQNNLSREDTQDIIEQLQEEIRESAQESLPKWSLKCQKGSMLRNLSDRFFILSQADGRDAQRLANLGRENHVRSWKAPPFVFQVSACAEEEI